MHYTNGINRPPYESESAILQVTSGCSHNQCEFCTYYRDCGFKVSPLSEVREDLEELKRSRRKYKRVFLQGGDAFVLSYEKLMTIAEMIHEYLPECETIGSYARITSMSNKSVEQLKDLRRVGYNFLSVGTESGDDKLLKLMNKGYTSKDILEQCKKLDDADIDYAFMFLNGLGGKDYGMHHAHVSAQVYNQLHPKLVSVASLTLIPGTPLHQKAKEGKFVEATEIERLQEIKEFLSELKIEAMFAAVHVSITVPIMGKIPENKKKMLAQLQNAIDHMKESDLRNYRNNIKNL